MQLVLILSLLVPLALGNISDLPDNVDYEIVTPPDPEIMNVHSMRVTEAKVGEQLVIGTAVTNNDNSQDWHAVVITEVRDTNGITVNLNWQSGIVQAGHTMRMDMSWVSEYTGDYEARTFVISSLENPRALSFSLGIAKFSIVD